MWKIEEMGPSQQQIYENIYKILENMDDERYREVLARDQQPCVALQKAVNMSRV